MVSPFTITIEGKDGIRLEIGLLHPVFRIIRIYTVPFLDLQIRIRNYLQVPDPGSDSSINKQKNL
jgi:hypothetical protein